MHPNCQATSVVAAVLVWNSLTTAVKAQLPIGCELSGSARQGSFAFQQQIVAQASAEQFGSSIGVSVDSMVVGDQIFGESLEGNVAVYQEFDGEFVPVTTEVRPGEPMETEFGNAVAIWGDIMVVGAPSEDIGDQLEAGAVYIYVRIDGTWTFSERVIATNPTESLSFGATLDVYRDTIAIGASIQRAVGQAMVLRRDMNGGWITEASLLSGDFFVDEYGSAVSLYGNRMAVGSALGRFGLGSMFVYERTAAGSWEEQANMANPGGSSSAFARSASLFGDILVVGAPDETASEVIASTGLAYIFEYDGDSGWSVAQTLMPPDISLSTDYGHAVQAENGLVLVSDHKYNVNGLESTGAVFVYTKGETEWILAEELRAPTVEADAQFGFAMSIHGPILGVTALPAVGSGSAYTFARCIEFAPTDSPTVSPTFANALSSVPSEFASPAETERPTASSVETEIPTVQPTQAPGLLPTALLSSFAPSRNPVALLSSFDPSQNPATVPSASSAWPSSHTPRTVASASPAPTPTSSSASQPSGLSTVAVAMVSLLCFGAGVGTVLICLFFWKKKPTTKSSAATSQELPASHLDSGIPHNVLVHEDMSTLGDTSLSHYTPAHNEQVGRFELATTDQGPSTTTSLVSGVHTLGGEEKSLEE